MLKREGIEPSKVICTLKLARHLDGTGVIPKYNLQYLRYYLGLEIDAKPHDALGDIMVLEAVFKRIYAKLVAYGLSNPVNEMIKVSNNPVLLPRMPYRVRLPVIQFTHDADLLGGVQGLVAIGVQQVDDVADA